jgi:nicotinate-nucleotide adenylyltransferase
MAKQNSKPRSKPISAGRVAPISSLSIPDDVTTVVVFGGSFDPPHRYHSETPPAILDRLYPGSGWLLYIPAAKSPLKGRGPIASDSHRLAMLKLAIRGHDRCSIWSDEIDRARWQHKHRIDSPSFTIDTLTRLRSIIPSHVSIRLLIGADQAANFHLWRQCRRIIRLAEPLVMPRDGISTPRSLAAAIAPTFWSATERRAWAARLAPAKPLPVSSTSVRDLIAQAPARTLHHQAQALRLWLYFTSFLSSAALSVFSQLKNSSLGPRCSRFTRS